MKLVIPSLFERAFSAGSKILLSSTLVISGMALLSSAAVFDASELRADDAGTVPSVIRKSDKDGDGKLNLEEYTEAAVARALKKAQEKAKGRFEKLDTNSDGAVDADEYRAARESRKKQG